MFNNKTFSLHCLHITKKQILKNIEAFLKTNIFDEIIVVEIIQQITLKVKYKKLQLNILMKNLGAALRKGMEEFGIVIILFYVSLTLRSVQKIFINFYLILTILNVF